MATRKNLNKNAISAFEEYGVSRREIPKIEITHQDGPSHKPVFYAKAWLGDREICTEYGGSKHEAKVKCAERALQVLHTENLNGEDVTRSTDIKDEVINPVPYKDPVSALSEYAQSQKTAVSFDKVAQEGPTHMPRFSIKAHVGDREFDLAQGSSIKDAKKKAACLALITLQMEGLLQSVFPETLACNGEGKAPVNKTTGHTQSNPVSQLNEYLQKHCLNPKYEYQQSGPPHKPVFKVTAILNGQEFQVTDAQNKKEGNRLVAEQILTWLEEQGKYVSPNSCGPKKPTCSTNGLYTPQDEVSGDILHRLTMDKMEELLLKTPESLVGRKVVSAIIMKDSNSGSFRVVSLAAGNRCIKGDNITDTGKVVHDSHAEILARRAFRRYLYSLLKDNQGLLDTGPSGKQRFKAHITFHLYISTAPCGDGAIFTHNEQDQVPVSVAGTDHKPIFDNRRTQGLLRSKMENGEGTIPIEADCPGQTYDGIKQGKSLRIMSCSDKICMWNCVGLQGALLSNFYEPIYLKSVTLGNLYHPGHLSRALCGRINHNMDDLSTKLLPSFHINYPDLQAVTSNDTVRSVDKSRPTCLNWNLGESEAEVTDGTTGETIKMMDSKPGSSRLCKYSFLQLYREISDQKEEVNMSYKQLKMKSDDYNLAKMSFLKRMEGQGYGSWISMPKEVQWFTF